MPKPEYTYLADYDNLQKLAKRPEQEKIDWLQERIKRNLLEPIKYFISERHSSFELGVMTIICCGIEAAGHFLAGRENNTYAAEDFRSFIKEYMPDFLPLASGLYEYFRCGLAHAFTIEQGSIGDSIVGLFEQEKRNETFYKVHPWKFFDSFKQGIEKYFADLKTDVKKREKFVQRFHKSFRFWINNPPSNF